MPIHRVAQLRFVVIGVLALVIVGGVVAIALAVPEVRGAIANLWPDAGKKATPAAEDAEGGELFRDSDGNPGIRLTAEAVRGHAIKPVPAKVAKTDRALPPQIGTVNYDNERLFIIRSRFPGELAEINRVVETPPGVPTKYRPWRFGDKVKQGDVLAVVWSQQLGAAKGALVDALCSLRLSQGNLTRQSKLWEQGVIPEAVFRQTERQVQADSNAVVTAERTLIMWKLTPKEIQDVRDEAAIITNQNKVRNSKLEARWAIVEIKVPWFDKKDPNRELTVVEKNTNLNDMVDPINSPPLFKLADLNRVQIWVHPPQEYLPILRERLARAEKDGQPLKWQIRFQSDADDAPAQEMEIAQVAPSVEPNQRTPMVMGYLNNPGAKYLIGQFVTATILVPADPDTTVQIPTEALNEVGGQALVFVERNADKREYTLRRVPVVARFKDVTIVRSKLTAADEKASRLEQQQGRRPIQPLRAGERVVTRGVVEMTAALEELLVNEPATSDKQR